MANIIVGLLVVFTAAIPIYSVIKYNKYIDLDGTKKEIEKRKTRLGLPIIVCFFTLFIFIIMNRTILTTLQSWFFDGVILEREVLTEPSEGGNPYYETERYFKLLSNPHQNTIGAFKFFVVFLFIGSFIISYYFVSQYDKRVSENDNNYDIDKYGVIFMTLTKVVLGAILILCLLEMPYAYYQAVRFIVPIGCCYLCIEQHKRSFFIGFLFYTSVAILFNPLYPVELTRLLWNSIDVVVAIIMFSAATKSYIDSR